MGGGNSFSNNPFTGQPWQRADLDTLFAGFWARWENTDPTPQQTQYLSLNDYTVEVVYQSLSVTITGTNPLNVSTGDTGRFIRTAGTPSTGSYSPTFAAASMRNSHGTCDAEIAFAPATGAGTVDTVVTASAAGCSRIAEGVRASASGSISTNTATIVVPPQIMIRTVIGEAGGQPGDIDQMSLLSTAVNRFGVHGFGGARDRDSTGRRTGTWQGVLTAPLQYLGSSNQTNTGPDQPLRNAARVFSGEVGDIVGGAPCYYSPTYAQFQFIAAALHSGQTEFPIEAEGPKCFKAAVRQIVVKTSVGANMSPGVLYAGAPAFVFIRERRRRDPAVVRID